MTEKLSALFGPDRSKMKKGGLIEELNQLESDLAQKRADYLELEKRWRAATIDIGVLKDQLRMTEATKDAMKTFLVTQEAKYEGYRKAIEDVIFALKDGDE